MKLSKATMAAFTRHAIAEYPREACGLVITHGKGMKYVPCRNVSDDPEDRFILPAEDYMAAADRGTILALLHSHTDEGAFLSDADLRAQEYEKIPFGILSVRNGEAAEFLLHEFLGRRVPLLGRTFTLGVLDCYSVVRDLYAADADERAAIGVVDWPFPEPVELLDFERGEFWEDDEELYLENFERAGFVEAPTGDLRPGDGILMMIGRKRNGEPVTVVNHAGVYLGNGIMLHHMQGQLSRREVYGGQWAEKTVKIVRYQP